MVYSPSRGVTARGREQRLKRQSSSPESILTKSALPQAVANEHAYLPHDPNTSADTFLPIRSRDVAKKPKKKLKEDTATGPDGVAARVRKGCATSLARPIAPVLRRMVEHGRWPECWRFHNIVPLYKKKAKSDPKNYRGVHLTSQLSKVAERVVGKLLLPQRR